MYVHVNKCTVCELRSSAPLPTLSEMSGYGMHVRTALTAKVLKLLRKSLWTNFFVHFVLLTNINENFF